MLSLGRSNGSGIKESKYNSDGSWYRLYEDGWLEQGGNNTNASHTRTQNLLIPFMDTTYNIYVSSSGNTGYSVTSWRTTTSFEMTNSYNGSISWYACGLAAGY